MKKIMTQTVLFGCLLSAAAWAQAAVSARQAIETAEQKTGAVAVGIEYDSERKSADYEILLRAPKKEFEVRIDADSGNVTRQESERENDPMPPAGLIGLAKAVDTVLARYSGSSLDEAELDRERGIWVYQVKVYDNDGARISLRLDAQTGNILKR